MLVLIRCNKHHRLTATIKRWLFFVFQNNALNLFRFALIAGVTYSESVFRKSFVENVEVFLLEGWHGTTLTFV
jgi:hypothetical protein